MSPIEPTRYADGRARLLAGVRRTYGFDQAAGIPAQWGELEAMLPLPGQRGGARYGVICTGDEAARTFEYMCAVEVEDFEVLPEGTGRLRLPEAHYAVFEHRGPLGRIQQTWAEVFSWLPRTGRRSAQTPDFELYPEGYDPARGDEALEIWLPIVREDVASALPTR